MSSIKGRKWLTASIRHFLVFSIKPESKMPLNINLWSMIKDQPLDWGIAFVPRRADRTVVVGAVDGVGGGAVDGGDVGRGGGARQGIPAPTNILTDHRLQLWEKLRAFSSNSLLKIWVCSKKPLRGFPSPPLSSSLTSKKFPISTPEL